MTEFDTSSTEPPYISRLALQSAPFNNVNSLDIYYGSTESEHRLNLLLHLSRSTDKIGLLIGKTGSGKTTLLNQFRDRVGDELITCHIDGRTQLNNAATLATCLRELGGNGAAGEGESNKIIQSLKQRLEQLKKLNIKSILLLDHSEMLSAESLAMLSNWLSWQTDEGHFLLQAIIVSNSEIDLALIDASRIQTIDLPAIEKQELSDYLMFRLTSAGYKGVNPFSDKELQQFYQLSSGNPAMINQLAHKALLGLQPVSSIITPFNFSVLAAGRRWVGVSLIVALLALMLIYQDNINQWLAQLPTNEVEINEQEILEIEDDAELATVITGNDDIKSNEQALRDELASLLAEIPNEEDVIPAQKSSDNAEEITLSDPNVDEVALTPQAYNEEWVLEHQGSYYTFQLMGSWDKQEVSDFIEKYTLTGDVAVFESMRNGRVWYALIYGVFESKQAALAASSNWPAPLNTLPSWLRRFDSVQKQIRSRVQE